MQKRLITPLLACLVVGTAGLGTQLLAPALADEKMNEGIGEFQAGKYEDALSLFQASLTNDFNNPKLHYYLASTYVHLNKRDAGIREYRIAYALDPDKEVGKLSKKALEMLGVEGESKPAEPTEAKGEKKAPSDPALDRVTAQLQKQAEEARLAGKSSTDSLVSELEKRNQQNLDRTKKDMQADNSRWSRRGRLMQLPLPDDALKQLDSLKAMYENQKSTTQDQSNRHSDEMQKSAENLQGLLTEKGKAGSPKLIPQGTNLYIRNYQAEAQAAKAATDKSPTAKVPTR
jgi:tetratricopeptide (TPR) repeat protein